MGTARIFGCLVEVSAAEAPPSPNAATSSYPQKSADIIYTISGPGAADLHTKCKEKNYANLSGLNPDGSFTLNYSSISPNRAEGMEPFGKALREGLEAAKGAEIS